MKEAFETDRLPIIAAKKISEVIYLLE